MFLCLRTFETSVHPGSVIRQVKNIWDLSTPWFCSPGRWRHAASDSGIDSTEYMKWWADASHHPPSTSTHLQTPLHHLHTPLHTSTPPPHPTTHLHTPPHASTHHYTTSTHIHSVPALDSASLKKLCCHSLNRCFFTARPNQSDEQWVTLKVTFQSEQSLSPFPQHH